MYFYNSYPCLLSYEYPLDAFSLYSISVIWSQFRQDFYQCFSFFILVLFFCVFSVCICVYPLFSCGNSFNELRQKDHFSFTILTFYYDCSNAFLPHYCIPFNRRSRILSSFYVLFYFPFTGKSFWRHSLQFRVKSVKLKKKRKKREN